MLNIFTKKTLLLAVCVTTLSISKVFGQLVWTVSYPPLDPNGGVGDISSDGFAGEEAYQRYRQIRANIINSYENYQIQVNRFDQKSIISANVVQNMNATKTQVSKYPYALALYQRSWVKYKQLESISAAAAQNVKVNKDIASFQTRQNQIINDAVNDYHKGQYVQEVGDNENQLIQEAKMTVISESCLSKEQLAELKVLKVQIKDAQAQIAQLHRSTQPLNKIRNQINSNYQTIAQSIKSFAEISEKAIELFVPDEKVVGVIHVTQKVFETYADEAYDNDRPPIYAIEKALKEGYKEYKQELKNQKEDLDTREKKKIEVLLKQIDKEYTDWQKMDQKRNEAKEKIDEVINFTDDLIQRNQRLANIAAAKGEKMMQRCIDEYAKRKLN